MQRLALFVCFSLFASFAVPVRGSQFEEGSLMTLQGAIEFKVYVPSSYSGDPVPLVVVLHGGAQDADIMAAGTRWNDLAEAEGFIVLYPEQSLLRNKKMCWNWFFEANQHRGYGEPFLIAEATRYVMRRYNIDRSMVYVCGMSAGAAMAAIVAVCYPDIFAAVGIHSGLEYRAADSVNSAYSAMESGGPDPDVAAEAAYMEILKAGAQRNSLPAIVFHGTGDEIVNIVNGNQTAEQFVILNEALGRILESRESEGFEGKPYTVTSYFREGETRVEYWTVEGLGHAWSGGSLDGGQYNDPEAPDATLHMWNFFKKHPL